MTRWFRWTLGATLALAACTSGKSGDSTAPYEYTPPQGEDTDAGAGGGAEAGAGAEDATAGSEGAVVPSAGDAECEAFALRFTAAPRDGTEIELLLGSVSAADEHGDDLAVTGVASGVPFDPRDRPVIGTVPVPPEGAVTVRVVLEGGTYELSGREGALDLCGGGPISFKVQRSQLVRELCSVTVRLDLPSSLAIGERDVSLVPTYRVRFY